ncbi:alpha-L RNA-binding motif-containing protein [Astrocystis sublimbata]|nr:alpha-L RNA-binding motif-containing protein [Astrocystis sublimbata]
MKPRRFHGLKRPKLRQSWNKYNLYNIAMMRDPRIGQSDSVTFFQQKWKAKGMLRTYHGEHINESKWERMFSRRLLGAVNMPAEYMAQHDGSEMAAGRGSGIDEEITNKQRAKTPAITPYMQMTFAPMERRLDIAVFRAMFASSARQARQFCVHGAVKVNGKIVPYPAYRLNPGDMFQVDPDRVLYATGLPKRRPRKFRQPSQARREDEEGEAATEESSAAETEASEPEAQAAEAEQDPDTTDAPEPIAADMKPTRLQIQRLTAQAKSLLAEWDSSVTLKKSLRSFIKNAKPLLSRAGRANASPTAITDELSTLVAELNLGVGQDKKEAKEVTSSDPIDSLTDAEMKTLEERMAKHMREEEENPYDPSKPYGTPWKPRHYMSPFAFIPQYLEVNHNICSAVYLRHPVARKGYAEVPTPYSVDVNQLAFNWYLRRR